MGNFSKATLALTPLANDKIASSGHAWFGQAAVDKVEEIEGPLTEVQKALVLKEGYVDVPYLDSKGVWTIGVGQTSAFKNKTYKQTFLKREEVLVALIPKLARLPVTLQIELTKSAYRGGITGSKDTVKLINAGNLKAAAAEFLDNDEFRDPLTPQSIKDRMQKLSDTLNTEGDIESQVSEGIQRQLAAENVAPAASQELSEALPEEVGGLTAEEEAELASIDAELATRAQAEEELIGLTEAEDAELAAIDAELEARAQADQANLGIEHEGPASETVEQNVIESIV